MLIPVYSDKHPSQNIVYIYIKYFYTCIIQYIHCVSKAGCCEETLPVATDTHNKVPKGLASVKYLYQLQVNQAV